MPERPSEEPRWPTSTPDLITARSRFRPSEIADPDSHQLDEAANQPAGGRIEPAIPPAVIVGLIFLAAMLIGGNYVALKAALDHSSPLVLAALRTVVGGSFLLSYALLSGEKLPRRRTDYVSIFLVSLCITTVSSMTLVLGVNRIPAGVAALLSSTMPLWAAFLGLVLLSERLRGMALLGLLLGFVGAATLASPTLRGETSATGVGLLLVATFAWALGTVVMKLRDFSGMSPVMQTAIQLWMSAAVLFPVGLAVEGLDEVEWGWGLALPLAYAAIPAMAVSFALMATIVRHAPAAQAASPAYLIPVFGVIIAWIIRGETLTWVEAAGGVLVVVGVFALSMATVRAKQAAS